MYDARIILDSINDNGNRLTTFCCTYPEVIHNEVMTHRIFSRNAESSRATPTSILIKRVIADPFMPVVYGKNQPGMQGFEELDYERALQAQEIILELRDRAIDAVTRLNDLGLVKGTANRYLQPWKWITVIVSSTSWKNFFDLRQDSNLTSDGTLEKDGSLRSRINTEFPAEYHIQVIAHMMAELYHSGVPQLLRPGEWHLPFVTNYDYPELIKEGYDAAQIVMICAARCARVSYLNHENLREPHKDFALHDSLVNNKHWSPFEHPARAQGLLPRNFSQPVYHWSGNFFGFDQYRKDFPGESGE